MKIAPAHFDDRAETAIESAAARGLDHVNLPAHHGVTTEHSRLAIGQLDLVTFKRVHGPRDVLAPACTFAISQPGNVLKAVSRLDGAQQFAKGQFALAAHNEIYASSPLPIGIGGKAGIVTP